MGGNIQRGKLITHIQPIYPEELQREGIAGMVVLATDGSLKDLRVANNLVDLDSRLVNAATEAIRFWRYEPNAAQWRTRRGSHVHHDRLSFGALKARP